MRFFFWCVALQAHELLAIVGQSVGVQHQLEKARLEDHVARDACAAAARSRTRKAGRQFGIAVAAESSTPMRATDKELTRRHIARGLVQFADVLRNLFRGDAARTCLRIRPIAIGFDEACLHIFGHQSVRPALQSSALSRNGAKALLGGQRSALAVPPLVAVAVAIIGGCRSFHISGEKKKKVGAVTCRLLSNTKIWFGCSLLTLPS